MKQSCRNMINFDIIRHFMQMHYLTSRAILPICKGPVTTKQNKTNFFKLLLLKCSLPYLSNFGSICPPLLPPSSGYTQFYVEPEILGWDLVDL